MTLVRSSEKRTLSSILPTSRRYLIFLKNDDTVKPGVVKPAGIAQFDAKICLKVFLSFGEDVIGLRFWNNSLLTAFSHS